MTSEQDNRRAGKVEEMIPGGDSKTEDQSQSWENTSRHLWCKGKLEINILCKRKKQKRWADNLEKEEQSKGQMVRGFYSEVLKFLTCGEGRL